MFILLESMNSKRSMKRKVYGIGWVSWEWQGTSVKPESTRWEEGAAEGACGQKGERIISLPSLLPPKSGTKL